MKWFKHQIGSAGSGKESKFIFRLIAEFGGDGYMVYFVAMEIIGDDFDVNLPGFCRVPIKYFTGKVQLSRQKLLKILNFCDENGRISVNVVGKDIELNCPKFAEFCDDYTAKLLRSASEQSTDKVQKKSPLEKEEEREEEKKDDVGGTGAQSDPPPPTDDSPVFLKIPLQDNTEYSITEKMVDEYCELYPRLNIRQSLKECERYFRVDRPDKRNQYVKTLKGRITKWLRRDLDRGKNILTTGTPAKPRNPFPKTVYCKYCEKGNEGFEISSYEGKCPYCKHRYYVRRDNAWHEAEPPPAAGGNIGGIVQSLAAKFDTGRRTA